VRYTQETEREREGRKKDNTTRKEGNKNSSAMMNEFHNGFPQHLPFSASSH
jgi:hypothetical protein